MIENLCSIIFSDGESSKNVGIRELNDPSYDIKCTGRDGLEHMSFRVPRGALSREIVLYLKHHLPNEIVIFPSGYLLEKHLPKIGGYK